MLLHEETQDRRSFSGPVISVLSFNVEGISTAKQELLADICVRTQCQVLCLQETHRGQDDIRPRVPGMRLVAERPHEQYGSAIYVKSGIRVYSTKVSADNNIEVLTVLLDDDVSITSIYKPPTQDFHLPPDAVGQHRNEIFIGDFNCHSTQWGYQDTDENGELLENWMDSNNLHLVHDPKLPHSFNSGRWRRGYNPDLIFVSSNLAPMSTKLVTDPIPKSQHRPIGLLLQAVVQPEITPLRRRFNFKKADWKAFAEDLDQSIGDLEPVPESYDQFVDRVRVSSRRHIPRGCRTEYVPGLSQDSAAIYASYREKFEADPFSADTVATGEALSAAISADRRKSWQDLIESVDMTHNSKKAWSTLKRINKDPKRASTLHTTQPTANQVAHQLLLNGKTGTREKRQKVAEYPEANEELCRPFTLEELDAAICTAKAGKAAGLDDIMTEQIKNLGPAAKQWLLCMYNNCLERCHIPKIWRRARVVALLKPGKDAAAAKSYRPISLLCHTYKLFERLILTRLSEVIDPLLIKEQAGFRPGKSCVGQLLNLTQHIEDGFQKGAITGAVFVDLSAAYDTVNHRLLLHKVHAMTHNSHLTNMMRCLIQNRRFFVELSGKKSRWRKQKNGLPQGSVLAPILFNIYVNDQPIHPKTRSFIYADDLCITAQSPDFPEAETTLSEALVNLTSYYDANHLRANPSKTQVCAFHLKNKSSNRKLKISWNGTLLEHCDNPVYLGVTLDRSLTFKAHVSKLKGKVSTRNALLHKLSTSSWGSNPSTIRSTALALSFSAAEYACPVWGRSAHAKKLDPVLNTSCRCITGCMKPTKTDDLYLLSGIAPPDVRRTAASQKERLRQSEDERHPLYNHSAERQRLKSRRSFLATVSALEDNIASTRIKLWNERLKKHQQDNHMFINPSESLPPGSKLPWITWRSLNRLRSGMGRCKRNMLKWGYIDGAADCECMEGIQTMPHLLRCNRLHHPCTDWDLAVANDVALACARHWETVV